MTNEEKDAIVEHLRINNNPGLTPTERLIKRGWLGIFSEHDKNTITITQAGLVALEKALLDQERQEQTK